MRNPALSQGRVWILTATDGYLGEIVSSPIGDETGGGWIVMRNASWVADTGRRHVFLRDGVKASEAEIECYPANLELAIPVSSIIGVTVWTHELPKESQ